MEEAPIDGNEYTEERQQLDEPVPKHNGTEPPTEIPPASSSAVPLPSHMFNADVHPAYIRFGIPIYLVCTFALLLASDLGSGVSADLRYSTADGEILTHGSILTVSIFSSVKELWDTGSYPLALLIVVTSICWPYLKLALAMYAWVAPFSRPSLSCRVDGPDVIEERMRIRETIIEWADATDKWSFVDIFVLTFIMVAFRSTIDLNHTFIDVVIVPKWGFYGFIVANTLSLWCTHFILLRHRLLLYGPKRHVLPTRYLVQNGNGSDQESTTQQPLSGGEKQRLVTLTKLSPAAVALSLVVMLALQVAGATMKTFTFKYSGVNEYEESFSLFGIGARIPDSSLDPNEFLIRFLQAFYFLLSISIPLWIVLVCAVTFFWPMTIRMQRRWLFLLGTTFAWSAVEVFVISAIFSVLQIPEFGTGIVDSGCESCYNVDATISANFVIICLGAAMNVVVTIWLLDAAHTSLYCRNGGCCTGVFRRRCKR